MSNTFQTTSDTTETIAEQPATIDMKMTGMQAFVRQHGRSVRIHAANEIVGTGALDIDMTPVAAVLLAEQLTRMAGAVAVSIRAEEQGDRG